MISISRLGEARVGDNPPLPPFVTAAEGRWSSDDEDSLSGDSDPDAVAPKQAAETSWLDKMPKKVSLAQTGRSVPLFVICFRGGTV